ncbi:MAG: selenium metabolism-associated LysR family transcriptional regulator [Chloroflexota bacterium]
MIDLAKLHVFLYCAENASFSKAAKLLHVSQPTVSHHIKLLERELGAALFDRSGGELKLTEAGRILLPRARKLLRDSIAVEQMMGSLDDRVVGHLRIACSTTTGKYILPQFAARFRQRHRHVQISIRRCTASHVVSRLLNEDANLGVVSYDACTDGLDCQHFFTDHIILIAPAHHPWVEHDAIDPSDLLGTPMIIREPESGTRQVLLAELGAHDISLDDLDIFLEVGNAEAIVRAVEAGFGVSFVSYIAAACAIERGTIVRIPIRDFDLRRNIYMIRRELRSANRALEAFWAFVHDPANSDLLHLAEI